MTLPPRSRDLRWPLSERTLEELDFLVNEPGNHSIQRFGFKAVAQELLRRLRAEETK